MTISAEERSRINSQNGRNGGPKTSEGKRRSSQNALKHGLRAETLCLPNEDPEALQGRLDEWQDFYQPRSPAEREFLNKAVLSLQQSDRLRRAQEATLADRVRDARFRWDDQREDEVAQLAAMLEVDPAGAVRKLKRSAAGCRWLLEKWGPLKDHLDQYGWWTAPALLHEATRLLGMRPEQASTDADVYLLRLMNLSVATEQNRLALMQMVKPENVPDAIREAVQGRPMKEDYSRQHLAERVAREVAALIELQEYLRTELDEPSLAGAEDRAMVLDGESGRLWHRYAVAAENSFHRAYQNFLKARAKEALLIEEVSEIALPNEPNLSTATGPTPLPNEPNVPVECTLNGVKPRISAAVAMTASSPVETPLARRSTERPGSDGVPPCECSGSPIDCLPNEPNFEAAAGTMPRDAVASGAA